MKSSFNNFNFILRMELCRCQRILQSSVKTILNFPVTAVQRNFRSQALITVVGVRTCNQFYINSRPISLYTQRNQSTQEKNDTKSSTTEENENNDSKAPSKALVKKDFFDSLNNKSKETFLTAIEVFINRDKHARGHVEFIYAALKHMKEFGVHRDIEAYKKLVDIFPKGKLVASNMWQVEFMHFPKQQQCGVDLLEQMESMGVCPDSELEEAFIIVFGDHAFPLRKLRRMAYWMPKFKNLSPWPVPDPLPENGLLIAKLAIERITSVDLQSKVSVFYPLEELEDSIDPTWIVSGQSPDQQRLIEEHDSNKPIYVEGAFRIWLSRACINYFILRTEPKPIPLNIPKKDPDDVGFLQSIFNEDYIATEVVPVSTVHEQADGVILAVCATGTSSHDSVLSWIRFLERTNPRLGKDISILFTLKSPLGPTDNLESIPPSEEQRSDGFLNASDGRNINNGDNESKFVTSSSKSNTTTGITPGIRQDSLGVDVDPYNPDLSQIGIETNSDTRFINWPHHFNKNQLRNDSSEK